MRFEAVAAPTGTRGRRVRSFLLAALGTMLLLLLESSERGRMMQQMLRVLSFVLVILCTMLNSCQRGRMVQEMLVCLLLMLEIVDWILIEISKSQDNDDVS